MKTEVYCPLCADKMVRVSAQKIWSCNFCQHEVSSKQEALDQLNARLKPQMEAWAKLHGIRDV